MWPTTLSPRRNGRADLAARVINKRAREAAAPQGFTLVEVLVGIAIMAVVGGAISILVGTAIQAKLITSVRSSNTETARSALEWMTERIRNAGLNLRPSAQPQLRCRDMVVAQDLSLLPTTTSVFVSGDTLNTVTAPPYPDVTIGYYLGSDPAPGATVVMEYNQACSGGATSIAANSTPLTSPKAHDHDPLIPVLRRHRRHRDQPVEPNVDPEDPDHRRHAVGAGLRREFGAAHPDAHAVRHAPQPRTQRQQLGGRQ